MKKNFNCHQNIPPSFSIAYNQSASFFLKITNKYPESFIFDSRLVLLLLMYCIYNIFERVYFMNKVNKSDFRLNTMSSERIQFVEVALEQCITGTFWNT